MATSGSDRSMAPSADRRRGIRRTVLVLVAVVTVVYVLALSGVIGP